MCLEEGSGCSYEDHQGGQCDLNTVVRGMHTVNVQNSAGHHQDLGFYS